MNQNLDLADRQLKAYNARNIDEFMACWAENAKYYAHPDQLLANGISEIRQRHVQRFEDTNLHGKLISRVSVGKTVIDYETVTRTFPDGIGTMDVAAIYEIQEGKIQTAWFIFGEVTFSHK